MTRTATRRGLTGGAALLLLALGGAQQASVLSRTSPGLWEVSGVPGRERPARMCIADLERLTRFEHRAASCTITLLRDRMDEAEVQYSCSGRGFGRTTLKLLTPRSLRVETQGISGGAPFHYVLQARRIGACPGH